MELVHSCKHQEGCAYRIYGGSLICPVSQSRTLRVSPFPLAHCTLPVSSVFSGVLLAVYGVLFTSKTIVDQRLKRAPSKSLLRACFTLSWCVALWGEVWETGAEHSRNHSGDQRSEIQESAGLVLPGAQTFCLPQSPLPASSSCSGPGVLGS